MEPNQFSYGQPNPPQSGVPPVSGPGQPPAYPVPGAVTPAGFAIAHSGVPPQPFQQPQPFQAPQPTQPAMPAQPFQSPYPQQQAVLPAAQPAGLMQPGTPSYQKPPKPVIRNPIMYYMGPASMKERLKAIGATLLAVGVMVACIILIIGFVRQPARYRQLQQVSVQEASSITDGRYTLQIPKEFVVDQRDADSVMYVHVASDKPDAEVLARLSATAVYANEDNIADLQAELTNQAIQQKGAVYDGFIVDHIKSVLSDLEGELTADTFMEGTANNNKPSLGAGFSYKKNDGSLFRGRIMVLFGEKHMYILTAVSGNDRWEANEAVWNEVFNSYTVDTTGQG